MNKKGVAEILIILIVGVLALGGFGYWFYTMSTKENQSQTVVATIQTTPQSTVILPQNKAVNAVEGEPFTLKGYFMNYEYEDWGEMAVCDGFVTIDGTESIIEEFRNSIRDGNTINKILDNQLVVNLDISGLNEEQLNLLKSSSSDSPVEVSARKRILRDMGASTCFSFIEIDRIK